MSTILTTDHLLSTDKQLSNLPLQWRELPSQESVDRFVAAAQKKQFKAIVVDNKEEALKALIGLLPDGAEIFSTGSVGLEQIGYTQFAINNPNKWNNLKAKQLAEKEPAKLAELQRQINNVQYLITTPVAVTEDACVFTADLTNTRVAPTMGAQNLIILVGGQKLVPDLEAARRRLLDYVWALESARVRIAFNLPATYPNFQAQLVGPNPFGAPGRITFLYVKEELGF